MTRVSSPASGEPFTPEGVVWVPVSRRLARARWLVLGVVTLVALVVAVGLAVLIGSPWAWLPVGVVVVTAGWVAVLIPRQVGAMAFAERADDLLVRRGILVRSLLVVPYGRLQYVDVTAGPLARWAGIASVQLHTASPGTDATIDGLPPEQAALLRDHLAARGEARLAGL